MRITVRESRKAREAVQPGRYLCVRSFTHGNMGSLFRKGKTYEVTDAGGGDYWVGGVRVGQAFFDDHFTKENHT